MCSISVLVKATALECNDWWHKVACCISRTHTLTFSMLYNSFMLMYLKQTKNQQYHVKRIFFTFIYSFYGLMYTNIYRQKKHTNSLEYLCFLLRKYIWSMRYLELLRFPSQCPKMDDVFITAMKTKLKHQNKT